MKKLFALCLVVFSLAAEPASKENDRFDFLVAIKNGNKAQVEAYCKRETLDVSRHLSSVDDTPVHMAIRALISEYEKQADYEKTLKNFSLWAFIGSGVGGLTWYYKDHLWHPVTQANTDLLAAANWQDGLGKLANLSSHVLLMTASGTIIYMALRKLYFSGQTLLKDRRHWQVADERVHVVELLISHPSFNPDTVNGEGLTPYEFVAAERSKVKPDSYLAKILTDLEDQILAKTRRTQALPATPGTQEVR